MVWHRPRPASDWLLALAVFACLLRASIASAAMQDYSDKPLREPVFDFASTLTESVRLNNWLLANRESLAPERVQGIRERLHALIDARIKHIYQERQQILPAQPDAILPILFSWTGILGVYGAEQAYSAVRGGYPGTLSGAKPTPSGFKFTREGDMVKLESTAGDWAARFPYYFFVFGLGESAGWTGTWSQGVAISMGTAKIKDAPGYSQATLLIAHTRGVDPALFQTYWRDQFGISATAVREKLGASQIESQRAFDPAAGMHKEVVFLKNANGQIALAYSGLDGTYQWNRPHFLDFVRTFKPQKSIVKR